MDKPMYDAVGRRKESIARVRLTRGSGLVQVNGRSVHDYFKRQALLALIQQPFQVTQTTGTFDVKATVMGGGVGGQAGAVRLGIARALAVIEEGYRKELRRTGLLTRDPRMKERKKYGLAGARKRFQFSKR
jgi:small subunit ribosomal protein S9